MGRLFCEYPPKQVNRPEAVRSRKERRSEIWNRKPPLARVFEHSGG
jgi:hypothetical protein